MTNLHILRDELTAASARLQEVKERRAALEAELREVAAQEREAHARVSTLNAEIRRLQNEPQTKARLEGLMGTLRARLAKTPQNSPTGQRARETLPALEDESFPAANRLEMVRSLLNDLEPDNREVRDRQIWDSRVPHLPGREPRKP